MKQGLGKGLEFGNEILLDLISYVCISLCLCLSLPLSLSVCLSLCISFSSHFCYASISCLSCCKRPLCFSANVADYMDHMHFTICCLWTSSLFIRRGYLIGQISPLTIRPNQEGAVTVATNLLGAQPCELDIKQSKWVGEHSRKSAEIRILYSLT